MLKNYVKNKLQTYVRQYFELHPDIKLIVVAGTTGKTTTKTAIATVLSRKFRIRMSDKNENTPLDVCLNILGIESPVNQSFLSWRKLLKVVKGQIKEPSDVDVIIIGIDTSSAGEMAAYGTYLRPAIGVVTAVGTEHMDVFGSLENVAGERLALANFSALALINRDDIEGRFASFLTNQAIDTYGTTNAAEYRFETSDVTPQNGYSGTIFAPELSEGLAAKIDVVGENSLRPVMAAVAVALKLGMTPEEVKAGVETIHPIPGHMNLLRGMQDSLLIDDTDSSDPVSAAAALQTLYSFRVPQRIVIFGDMHGLNVESANEHRKLGNLCDPNLLSWVITVGPETEQHLAPEAKARGCQVKSFKTAIEAGAFAHKVMEQNAMILAKGSGDGIFLEEALKIMLHETSEDSQLVRQSPEWMEKKNSLFAQ